MVLRRFVVLVLILAACGGGDASGPPEIQYGRDICVECNMIISEARHSAAYRLDDGTEKVFDDVGGMVKHGREHGEFDRATAWVHDYQTEEWVEADVAFYVPTESSDSPMGHGIIAFADRERAATFAEAVDGEIIDWGTVLQLPIIDGLVGGHHHDDAEATSQDSDHEDETDHHDHEEPNG